MLAPVDLLLAAEVANQGPADEAEADMVALAQDVIEAIQLAREDAEAEGLGTSAIATAMEQMGSALLVDLVDDALDAVDNKVRFNGAASRLCLLVRNAQVAASELGVTQLGEVLYKGSAGGRKLRRLYQELLSLSGPELLASMGLGDEEEGESAAPLPPGVSIDAVEMVRPLLKIKEAQSQKMMQDMMMKEMGGDVGKDGAGSEKALGRSVEMLEQLLDSGAVGPEELDSLKEMMESQMGMPVDELLERKDELEKELPPEGKKLFVLMERLFGKDGPSAAAEAGGLTMPEEIPDDPSVKVTISEKKLPVVPDVAAPPPPPPGTNVKITVKKPNDPAAAAAALKKATADAPTVPAPAGSSSKSELSPGSVSSSSSSSSSARAKLLSETMTMDIITRPSSSKLVLNSFMFTGKGDLL